MLVQRAPFSSNVQDACIHIDIETLRRAGNSAIATSVLTDISACDVTAQLSRPDKRKRE